MKLLLYIFFSGITLASLCQPVSLSPENPCYFFYKGKPVLLLSSDHHYGAVIDSQFDYNTSLEYLGNQGMNITRIYAGAMFEPDNKFYRENPLGPAAGKQILPWVQTTQAGAAAQLGGFKYDLGHWNEAYFTRTHPAAEPPCQVNTGDLTRTKLVPQKKLLKDFMYSFDFTKMERDTSFRVASRDACARGITQKGRLYALYLHHSKLLNTMWCSGYQVKKGSFRDTVMYRGVPRGNYKVDWIAPETGIIIQTHTVRQKNSGTLVLASPVYAIDIALRISRK